MVVVELGYQSYVLPNKDAIALVDILEKAEVYEHKWIPKEKRAEGGDDYTHHVYDNERHLAMKVISESLYRMAKLAGKPTKE